MAIQGSGMVRVSLSLQTMYADLVQRGLDAEFDQQFDEGGQFLLKQRNSRSYFYYQGYDGGRRVQKYVGPADDPALRGRVERFRAIKADAAERRRIVAALVAGGLPAADPLAGDILDALWRAGVFRLRGVLVGTAAFQAYPALLGVRLPAAQMRTGDIDIAQFHSISVLVEDSLPPILEVLRGVDPSFRSMPHMADPIRSTRFVNGAKLEVEFLTPNRAGDDKQGKPAMMPALGGAAAEPLRFLDFLIYQPVRAVLLHRAGVPVVVPAPGRFAVHKLIVASRRRRDPVGMVKAAKDVAQAGTLFAALGETRRGFEVGEAWAEAWKRGPSWREALADGRSRLSAGPAAVLEDSVLSWARDMGEAAAALGWG